MTLEGVQEARELDALSDTLEAAQGRPARSLGLLWRVYRQGGEWRALKRRVSPTYSAIPTGFIGKHPQLSLGLALEGKTPPTKKAPPAEASGARL